MDFFSNKFVQLGIFAIAGLIIILLRHSIVKESPLRPVIKSLGLRLIGATAGFIVGMLALYLTNQLYIALIVIFVIQFLVDLLIFSVKKTD